MFRLSFAATHKPGNNDRNIKLWNIESREKYSKCLGNSHPSFHLTMHQLSVISLVYLQTFLIPKYVFIINDNKIKNKIYHIVTFPGLWVAANEEATEPRVTSG
jgi:hypothetical protein